MTLIAVTTTNYRALRHALATYYPEQKHSHRTEAFAYALGLRTYEELRIKLSTEGQLEALLSGEMFLERLHQLGYKKVPVYDLEALCIAACVGGPLPESSKLEAPKPAQKPGQDLSRKPETAIPAVTYKKSRRSLSAADELAIGTSPEKQ